MADLDSLLDEACLDYAQSTMDKQYDLRPKSPPPMVVLDEVPYLETEHGISSPPITPPQSPRAPVHKLDEDVMDHIKAFEMKLDDELLQNPPPPQIIPQQQELSAEDELARRHNKERERKADLITDIQNWADACKSLNQLEKEETLFQMPLTVLQDKHATWNSKNTLRKSLKKARDIWCAICAMTGYGGKYVLSILQMESPIDIMRMVHLYCAQVLVSNIADESLTELCRFLIPTQSAKGHLLDLCWTFVSFVHEEWRRQQETKAMYQKKVEAEKKKLEMLEHEQLIQRAQAGQAASKSMSFFNVNNTTDSTTTTTTTTTTNQFQIPNIMMVDNAEKALKDLDMDDDDDDVFDVQQQSQQQQKEAEPQIRRSRRHR